MGCGSSQAAAAEDGSIGNIKVQEVQEFQRKFQMDEQKLENLYNRFRKHDGDKSGHVELKEFCRALEYDQPTPYIEKLFALFDTDGSGMVDFREFVIGITQFTAAGKDDKLRFAFWVYDYDGDGSIDKEEMGKMLRAFHLASDKQIENKVNMIFHQCDRNRDGAISFDEFRMFAAKFPSLVFPAYSLWYRTSEMGSKK
eukprot:TRINITY_DN1628_c1_g1_i6.p1 TRINITY_DN1628_c1_g1~~TRINITY_DN1628_c1_g1_i6.p1  ORF type:complete len:198 (-),score=39.02 TRINITY_DN1628_c1_g1_i6:7-600(-)